MPGCLWARIPIGTRARYFQLQYFIGTAPYTDFFGYLNGTVTGLRFEGAIVLGCYDYTGAIAGWIYKGEVSFCYAIDSKVIGTNEVGGLVGYNYYGTVIGCYYTGDVSGTLYVGGFAGRNIYGEILSSYSKADVTGSSSCGGFLGNATSESSSLDCYWDGKVSNSKGAVTSNGSVYEIKQVDGSDVTWADAVEAMNEGIEEYGWEFVESGNANHPAYLRKRATKSRCLLCPILSQP